MLKRYVQLNQVILKIEHESADLLLSDDKDDETDALIRRPINLGSTTVKLQDDLEHSTRHKPCSTVLFQKCALFRLFPDPSASIVDNVHFESAVSKIQMEREVQIIKTQEASSESPFQRSRSSIKTSHKLVFKRVIICSNAA